MYLYKDTHVLLKSVRMVKNRASHPFLSFFFGVDLFFVFSFCLFVFLIKCYRTHKSWGSFSKGFRDVGEYVSETEV